MSDSEKTEERVLLADAEEIGALVAMHLDAIREIISDDFAITLYARNLLLPDDKNGDMLLSNDPNNDKMVAGLHRILKRPHVQVAGGVVVPTDAVH